MGSSPASSSRVVLAAVAAALVACSTLGPRPELPEEAALASAASGRLVATAARFAERAGPEASGFELLLENEPALLWRLALVDEAIESIDAQYFIWQDDEAGRLLLRRLVSAADRGVRVRLLVDDIGIMGSDRGVAVLSKHPNLEVRVFNPNPSRRGVLRPWLRMGASMKQLNRRMHNKLLVADGAVAVAGGRNIGNPYFGLDESYNFRDLDVLVTGAVVPQLQDAFDEYWNADLAYPGEALDPKASADDLPELLDTMLGDVAHDRELLDQGPYPVERRDWSDALQGLAAGLDVGTAVFLQDEPVTHQGEQRRLVDLMDHLVAQEEGELLIVTPYMIPVEGFLEELAGHEERGVDVVVLTGGMDSNNHTMAHSHYKKYRRRILETGSTLYEFKAEPEPAIRAQVDVPPVTSEFVALHVKTLVGDRKRCFIGSLNLDPRAIVLNTENGLLIESEDLSQKLAAAIDAMRTPTNAWSVTQEGRKLRWTSGDDVRKRQPARGFGQRVSDFFYRLLPIESQL